MVEPSCKVKGPEPLGVVAVVLLVWRLEKSSGAIDEVVDPIEIARPRTASMSWSMLLSMVCGCYRIDTYNVGEDLMKLCSDYRLCGKPHCRHHYGIANWVVKRNPNVAADLDLADGDLNMTFEDPRHINRPEKIHRKNCC